MLLRFDMDYYMVYKKYIIYVAVKDNSGADGGENQCKAWLHAPGRGR